MGVDGISKADIFDEYFDDEKPKYKYGIKINGKVFAKNMTLGQCMKLSVKLGNKGISHSEYRYEDKIYE